ncbi:hypothetical protein KUDE01_000099 [Dissostichus eleginoides]|uniref:Uncharacterized protein n=1 Tax=Dissostichus eleginoides TaxID=100907 RepID=A0AAD9B1Z4_DISEL|nr:hypothetical protein KUDE01_000099 [Dissostichus eleginoides]
MTHHKTNEAFGTAKMLLEKEEYGWLLKLIALKTKCASTKELSKFVFFNTTFGRNRNLTKHLQMVWSEMQLRGEVNFITLRTAVATFARDRYGEDSVQRKSMAKLMCHDTATADSTLCRGPLRRTVPQRSPPLSSNRRRRRPIQGLCLRLR